MRTWNFANPALACAFPVVGILLLSNYNGVGSGVFNWLNEILDQKDWY